MTIKQTIVHLALVVLLVSAGNAVAAQIEDKYCSARPVLGREGVNLCQIPLDRLLAAPEKYDGKLIRVTGFLVWHNERFVLYGSRDIFVASAGENGVPMIGLELPDSIQNAATSSAGANGVTIFAEFEWGPAPSIPGSPGVLKKVVNAYITPLLRDARPRS
jgi:hypothetical protein